MKSEYSIKEAFIAGFMATGEGYNGEYVRSGSPKGAAEHAYEEWIELEEYLEE